MFPREILTYVSDGEFRKADYPWLTSVRLVAKGGDAGASADGTPGEPGQTNMMTMPVAELDDTMRVVIGRGGRGGPGAQDGENGFVLIELYDEAPVSGC